MISLIPEDEAVSMSVWIPITKAYKYELRPTKNQEVKMNQTLSICRHVYNDSLSERKEGYENGGWNVQYNDQQNFLPILRNNNETGKYLQKVYEQVLQDVVRRVDKAYKNFYRRVKNGEKPGFPRFKGYGRYDSFTFPQYGNGCQIVNSKGDKRGEKDENGDIIRLSNIGEIKFIKHRKIGDNGIPYRIKIVTVKKDATGKWSVSFAVDTFVELDIPIDIYDKVKNDIKELDDLIYNLLESMNKTKIYEKIEKVSCNIRTKITELSPGIKTMEDLNKKCVGIDMGLETLTMLSTRQKVDPQKYLRKSEKRLAIEQRKLSKKQRYEQEIIDKVASKKESKKQKKDIIVKKKVNVNSKNREKQRIKVAKIHKKIANQRKNFNHNLSRTLVDNFDLIIFEKLNIQQMMSNHHYAKSIADASWYQIQMFTKYKAEWAGKTVDFVEAKNTTRECSKCGKINDMPIWKRTMVCSCGNIEDRDIDSSFVIRDRSTIYQQLRKEVEMRMSRDATSRFQALGEGASAQSNERVSSVNQETLSNTKGVDLEDTIRQAQPFRAG